MATLLIEHVVRDFDAWKGAFDDDPVGRRAGGVRSHRVRRLSENPNHVVVDLEFDTVVEAEAFAGKLHRLWEDAGPRLGLESPSTRVLETVEQVEY